MRIGILILLVVAFVKSGSSQPFYFPPITGNEWQTVSPASLGWDVARIDSLMQFLESNDTKAFLLLKDGRIVVERYFGTFTQDSVWYWASAGKTLTAFLVGMAQQNNQLNLTEPASKYLGAGWTSSTPAQEERITIWHQLTMTSGLNDGVPDNHCTDKACLVYLADAGTRWAYHNAPYTLLDEVLSNATGRTLNALVFQHLTQPAGISGAFIRMGFNNVFVSRARSMARFGLLMLNRGNWNGNQIMTDLVYFDQMITPSQLLNRSYGYLWWLNGQSSFMLPELRLVFPGMLFPQAPPQMYSALGKNGQILSVVPGMNLVMVRLGNDPETGLVPAILTNQIWERLQRIIGAPLNTIEPQKAQRVKLWPVPATNYVTVQFQTEGYMVEVFDGFGRKVLFREKCDLVETLQVSNLKPGLYFLRATGTDNQSEVIRFTVKRP